MDEVGAKPASVINILKFAKKERKMFIYGLILTFISAFSWPAFSVLYGKVFKILADSQKSTTLEINALIFNSICFIVLGVIAFISSFGSCSILATVGEKVTMRMRLLVFKVI